MTYQIQDLPASFKTLRHAKEHIAKMSVSERVSRFEYKGYIFGIRDNEPVTATEVVAEVEQVRYGKTKTIGIYKS